MGYVALLCGINVGGRNIVRMPALRACFVKAGFEKVSTFIQSGNEIFESAEERKCLEEPIERALSEAFRYGFTVLVRSLPQMERVLLQAPGEWSSSKDLRGIPPGAPCVCRRRPPITAPITTVPGRHGS